MSEVSCARCEFAPLEAVLLHRPGPEVEAAADPAAVLYERPIVARTMDEEYEGLARLFVSLGVKTHWIWPELGPKDDRLALYNMMYCRDLFFMTPRGAILSRMASPVRRGEVAHARKALQTLGIPILHEVGGEGTFEGADALWVADDLVAVGVGKRTNSAAFAQLTVVLAADKVRCASLPPPERTQHLLGGVQFVDRGRVLVRTGIVDDVVTAFLRGRDLEVIAVPESTEVRTRQAMNVVVVAPGALVMSADCPETRALYENAGLRVAGEAPISQLINGGGGLACATGILSRSPSPADAGPPPRSGGGGAT